MPAIPELNVEAVIGFEGDIPNGLIYTNRNGRDYIVYALGSTVVVRDVEANTQCFCAGHSFKISCLAVSHDGSKIASGQANYSGFKADVIVWDMDAVIRNGNGESREGELIARLTLHMGKVQDVAFSADDQYLATLGGQDDNSLVIWNASTGTAICGTPAATDSALCVEFYNQRNDRLVTAGNYNTRVWQFDVSRRKLTPADAVTGQVKRIVQCVAIDACDEYAYCGTKTGDLLQISLNETNGEPNPRYVKSAPKKFGLGIRCLKTVIRPSGKSVCLVGTGDGLVAMVSVDQKGFRSQQVMGPVTSIALMQNEDDFYIGTAHGNTYWCNKEVNAAPELRGTCHYGKINDVCFPKECSDLFITASVNDIRIWNSRSRQELLRIQVPNLQCNCIDITPNGGSILSGWNDGKIRSFYPESGNLKFVIQDAHTESCTAIAVTHDDDNMPPWRVISGGKDGRVRVWKITQSKQSMEATLKEHSKPVNCIRVIKDNTQCVSASSDGSCIVWDLVSFVRVSAMFANTNFQHILYHPDESQLLSCGSDRKITYWDSYDYNAIRIVDGSDSGAAGGGLLCMDIDESGEVFVSGGEDKLVKMWHYDEGETTAQGVGHSGEVTAIRISPDRKQIVSTGSEGAIFIWGVQE